VVDEKDFENSNEISDEKDKDNNTNLLSISQYGGNQF